MTRHGGRRALGIGPRRGQDQPGRGGMIIACCIPMLVITVILVATGIAGASFLAAAIACTLMKA